MYFSYARSALIWRKARQSILSFGGTKSQEFDPGNQAGGEALIGGKISLGED